LFDGLNMSCDKTLIGMTCEYVFMHVRLRNCIWYCEII